MRHIRLGIITGAAAFVLSFLLSLISGTPFPMVLLRAVLFAALFFGLGLGIAHLAQNVLDISAGSFSGQQIDISIGDDDTPGGGKKRAFGAEFSMPDSAFDAQPRAPKSPAEAAPDEAADTVDDISALFTQGGEAAAPAAAWEGGGGAARFEDSFPSGTLDKDAQDGTEGGGLAQNADYDYHTVGSIASPTGAQSSALPARNEGESSNLFSGFDSFVPGLPGVEGADSAYTSRQEEATESGSSPSGRSMAVGTVELSLQKPKSDPDFGNFDGKKMAGAIQTILKKDKE